MANSFHGQFGFWDIIDRSNLSRRHIIALVMSWMAVTGSAFADMSPLKMSEDQIAVTDFTCANRLREQDSLQSSERGHRLFYLKDNELGTAARSYIQQMRAQTGPTVMQFHGCYIYPVMIDARERPTALTGRIKITFKPEHLAKLHQDTRVKVLLEEKKIGFLGPFYRTNLTKIQDDLRQDYPDAVIDLLPFNELYLRMQTL